MPADDAWSQLPPARRQVLQGLAAEHLVAHGGGRSIIGFDGPEGGGKKQFADHLALAFAASGIPVLRTEMDAFHAPFAARDARGAESRYRASFDDEAFLQVLATPFRGGFPVQLGIVDPDADLPLETGWITPPPAGILIVHGPFLHRPVLHDVWDTTVWVDADPGLRAAHIARRLGDLPADVVAQMVESERLYVGEVDPVSLVDATFDNTEPADPVRHAAFCTVQPSATPTS